jgi:hypothetical protein
VNSPGKNKLGDNVLGRVFDRALANSSEQPKGLPRMLEPPVLPEQQLQLRKGFVPRLRYAVKDPLVAVQTSYGPAWQTRNHNLVLMSCVVEDLFVISEQLLKTRRDDSEKSVLGDRSTGVASLICPTGGASLGTWPRNFAP